MTEDEQLQEDQSSQHAEVTVAEAKEVTRARAADFRHLVGAYIRRHLPSPGDSDKPRREPPRVSGSHARLLPLLQIIPWGLMLMFGASFLWDFPGMELTIFGQVLPLQGDLKKELKFKRMLIFTVRWMVRASLCVEML